MKRNKIKRLELRVNAADWSRIKALANIYMGGNVSKWLLYGALEAPRVLAKKKTPGVKE